MQWLIDLIIEAIGIPPTFIDRGDPANSDYSKGDLTLNAAWHELDLSAIVGTDAVAILFNIQIVTTAVGTNFRLHNQGNVNVWNISRIEQSVANIFRSGDYVCPCTNGIVEYWGTPSFPPVWTSLEVTIKGWWL